MNLMRIMNLVTPVSKQMRRFITTYFSLVGLAHYRNNIQINGTQIRYYHYVGHAPPPHHNDHQLFQYQSFFYIKSTLFTLVGPHFFIRFSFILHRQHKTANVYLFIKILTVGLFFYKKYQYSAIFVFYQHKNKSYIYFCTASCIWDYIAFQTTSRLEFSVQN